MLWSSHQILAIPSGPRSPRPLPAVFPVFKSQVPKKRDKSMADSSSDSTCPVRHANKHVDECARSKRHGRPDMSMAAPRWRLACRWNMGGVCFVLSRKALGLWASLALGTHQPGWIQLQLLAYFVLRFLSGKHSRLARSPLAVQAVPAAERRTATAAGRDLQVWSGTTKGEDVKVVIISSCFLSLLLPAWKKHLRYAWGSRLS